MNTRLDELKSKCENEIARIQDLRYQTANLQTVINELKNDDNGEYTKVIKAVKEEVQKNLSNIKPLLDLALFSIIQSMRDNPDKYSSLVYHNNENSSKDNNHSSRQILPPPPYDGYIIEHYKSTLFEESEKLYTILVDQLVCEVINENVNKQSAEAMPSSLPALSLEGDDNKQG